MQAIPGIAPAQRPGGGQHIASYFDATDVQQRTQDATDHRGLLLERATRAVEKNASDRPTVQPGKQLRDQRAFDLLRSLKKGIRSVGLESPHRPAFPYDAPVGLRRTAVGNQYHILTYILFRYNGSPISHTAPTRSNG